MRADRLTAMGRITQNRRITTVRARDGRLYHAERPDTVVVEEPLSLRLNGQELALTMRTPGDDLDLTHGFLFSEGLIGDAAAIATARYCDGAVVTAETGLPENTYNVLDVATIAPAILPLEARRTFAMNSSCGVCGKASIDAVETRGRFDLREDLSTVEPAALWGMVDRLADAQSTYRRTGGLHATGLFTADGERIVVREDVGRHNAVDKVIGHALRNGLLPLWGTVLVVSSRASFEITQKAYMAGIPLLAAVSAPSSLALETAERVGMTLCAFARPGEDGDGRLNVCTGVERIDLSASVS